MLSKNFCCVTWKSLSKELAKMKHEEIADLVNDKHIPASVFAPVIEVLDSMHLNCPCCKSSLFIPLGKPSPEARPVAVDENVEEAPAVPAKKKYGKCPVCYGYGTSARKPRETEDDVNCINCHGTGKISDDTIKEHKVSAEVLTKIEQREEEIRKSQKGIKIDVTLPKEDDPDA